jgi:hypothetical protein
MNARFGHHAGVKFPIVMVAEWNSKTNNFQLSSYPRNSVARRKNKRTTIMLKPGQSPSEAFMDRVNRLRGVKN